VQAADAKPVTTGPQSIEAMRVSPDGQWLVFDSDRTGNVELYKLKLDGESEPVQLTSTPANEYWPVWSPNGSEIAFHSARSGPRALFVMKADGSGERQITSVANDAFIGDWSPDGHSIVFTLRSPTTEELYLTSRDAAGRWESKRIADAAQVRCVRWTRDGKSIVFLDGARALATMAPDGTGRRILADSAALHGKPRWIAVGRAPSVVYVGTGQLESRQVWAVSLSGAPPRLVASNSGQVSRRDEFDTDGRRLFFTVSTVESDVYIIDLKR
jgi:Tol biopolymer transport system component